MVTAKLGLGDPNINRQWEDQPPILYMPKGYPITYSTENGGEFSTALLKNTEIK